MDKKQNVAREDFRQYLMVVMGLSEASAKSYDAYVSGVEHVLLGKTVDAIVSSDGEMQAAIVQLRKHEPKNTASNYMSGLRAYYRFKNGREFGTKDTPERDGDIPFEVRKRLNDMKYRKYESENRLWQQLFQLWTAVVLVVPTLTIHGMEVTPLLSMRLTFTALLFSMVGLPIWFIVLKKPIRQAAAIQEHERKLASGDETCLEIDISKATLVESLCQCGTVVLLGTTFLLLFVSIFWSVLVNRPESNWLW